MRQTHARLTLDQSGNLMFDFSYNAGLVAALKVEIPYTDRSWEPTKKVWIISPKHADKLVSLAALYCGLNITTPIQSTQKPTIDTRTIKLEYLGAAKDRGNGEVTATGFCNNGWNVIFPVDVLKGWFDPDAKERPSEGNTLYTVLGLSRNTSQEEIKKSYRRLAKQWHPDVCKESDAVEQFKKLQSAYEILSDETKRKKYNAGLQLEASLATKKNFIASLKQYIKDDADYLNNVVYRAPLRCGWVLANGEQVLNRFVVKSILGWEDITQAGLTMVSSWKSGDDKFTIEWV